MSAPRYRNRGRARARTRSPDLPREAFRNPDSYVVGPDLWRVRNVCGRFAGELLQWCDATGVAPTACGLLAVLLVFAGTTHGFQLPVGSDEREPGTLAGVLGVCRRAVNNAIAALVRGGYVTRHARSVLVAQPWSVAGTSYGRVQSTSVLYLTPKGAALIERRGETEALTVVAGIGKTRRRVACGVVGTLLRAHRPELRRIAHRLRGVGGVCTPAVSLRDTASDRHLEKNHRGRRPAVVESAGADPLTEGKPRGPLPPHGHRAADCDATPTPTPPPGGGGLIGRGGLPHWRRRRRRTAAYAATLETLRGELERLYQARAFTVEQAWPAQWSAADLRGREWLRGEFERLYRRGLRERWLSDERKRRALELEHEGRVARALRAGVPPGFASGAA